MKILRHKTIKWGLLAALLVTSLALFLGYSRFGNIEQVQEVKVQEVDEGCVSLYLVYGGTPVAKSYYICVATLIKFDDLGEKEREVWSRKEGNHLERHRDCNLYLRVNQYEYIWGNWCDTLHVTGDKWRIVVHESGQVVAMGPVEKKLAAE